MTPPPPAPPSPTPAEGGIGCRALVSVLTVLVVFAAAAVSAGLALALGDAPTPLAERIGFGLYAAGAPISGLFAAVAGELPLAPLTDIIVWVLAAAGTVTWSERRSIPLWRTVAVVIAAALAYGAVVGSFLERV